MNKLLPLIAAFALATAAQLSLSPAAATEAGPGPRAAIHDPNVQRTLTHVRLRASRDAARQAVEATRFRSGSPAAAPQSSEAAVGPALDSTGQTTPTK